MMVVGFSIDQSTINSIVFRSESQIGTAPVLLVFQELAVLCLHICRTMQQRMTSCFGTREYMLISTGSCKTIYLLL